MEAGSRPRSFHLRAQEPGRQQRQSFAESGQRLCVSPQSPSAFQASQARITFGGEGLSTFSCEDPNGAALSQSRGARCSGCPPLPHRLFIERGLWDTRAIHTGAWSHANLPKRLCHRVSGQLHLGYFKGTLMPQATSKVSPPSPSTALPAKPRVQGHNHGGPTSAARPPQCRSSTCHQVHVIRTDLTESEASSAGVRT